MNKMNVEQMVNGILCIVICAVNNACTEFGSAIACSNALSDQSNSNFDSVAQNADHSF